ncbi:MAG: nitrogen fixation protein NifH [Nanoarchaeota archaeon]|nr:nitrogen fixation protein NifH [Nanoarchaeota archaeon]
MAHGEDEMNNIFDWLLELDNPSVRYFALRGLLDRPEDDLEVLAARRAIMDSDPVRKILSAQNPEGWWDKPGPGYSRKYLSTVWQLIFLAELGADGSHSQIQRGCDYRLSHAQAIHCGLSATANATPSGAIHCLDGNLIWALTSLGYAQDERLRRAVEWLAGAVTGEDFEWWYASSVPGPGFLCAANMKLPCAWGAVKALRALVNLPPALQIPKVKRAITAGVDFLFSRDLATADYPVYERVSGEWFKFGFPLSYTSDVLEAAFVLCEAGHGNDPRLRNAIDLIISKRQPDGRWLLKHSLNGKMWTDIEVKGKPSKWITLRALRVLKASEKGK